MLYCLEAAAPFGLPVVILDRPNPIGGDFIEGPSIRPGFESFVGCHPIPIRHGMTMGELARLYQAERVPGVDLTVVPCEGWRRSDRWEWDVPPSPNMPSAKTALVYPGMCLVEGTNLSEGRGTTRPFEFIGHPDVRSHRFVEHLSMMTWSDVSDLSFNGGVEVAKRELWNRTWPGVAFLPVRFRPTFQKHMGQSCGGVFLLVTDARGIFRPVTNGPFSLDRFSRRFWATRSAGEPNGTSSSITSRLSTSSSAATGNGA